MSKDNVRVCVRVRPVNDLSVDESCNVVKVLDDGQSLLLRDIRHKGTDKSYSFDRVYGEKCSTLTIFEEQVKESLSSVFEKGLSCTFFAHGSSGTGKTFTMHGNDSSLGMVQLSLESLFRMKEHYAQKPEQEEEPGGVNDVRIKDPTYEFFVSFFEIYCDKVSDLLNPLQGAPLPMRENGDGNVVVSGLTEVRCEHYEEFEKHYHTGLKRRVVHRTNLNDVSSRSHACVTVRVVKSWTKTNPSTTRKKRRGVNEDLMPTSLQQQVGRVALIDLSGAEDNRKTGNHGHRMIESAAINQSLFALSKLIHALKRRDRRIPYRDSKLTRLFKDSLGGENETVMLCTVSGKPTLFNQTLTTLNCAASSKQISHFQPDPVCTTSTSYAPWRLLGRGNSRKRPYSLDPAREEAVQEISRSKSSRQLGVRTDQNCSNSSTNRSTTACRGA
eukprot:Filipodium_phascolosomae@DN2340_c0_g1_i1.p1